MHMPKTRAPYPKEFRARAIDLVRTSGKTVEAVAEDLGV
jgi:transposase-like protein